DGLAGAGHPVRLHEEAQVEEVAGAQQRPRHHQILEQEVGPAGGRVRAEEGQVEVPAGEAHPEERDRPQRQHDEGGEDEDVREPRSGKRKSSWRRRQRICIRGPIDIAKMPSASTIRQRVKSAVSSKGADMRAPSGMRSPCGCRSSDLRSATYPWPKPCATAGRGPTPQKDEGRGEAPRPPAASARDRPDHWARKKTWKTTPALRPAGCDGGVKVVPSFDGVITSIAEGWITKAPEAVVEVVSASSSVGER